MTRFEHGHSRPSATFVYAATFLNAGSTAALRAALYRVIESLPGVQNLGPATDRLGRHGQAVGLVAGGAREELIFDPASTVVLEEETVAVHAGAEREQHAARGDGPAVHAVPAGRRGELGHGEPRAAAGRPASSSAPATAPPSSSAGTASPSPSAGTSHARRQPVIWRSRLTAGRRLPRPPEAAAGGGVARGRPGGAYPR